VQVHYHARSSSPPGGSRQLPAGASAAYARLNTTTVASRPPAWAQRRRATGVTWRPERVVALLGRTGRPRFRGERSPGAGQRREPDRAPSSARNQLVVL